jgi:hypothetical protein
MKLEIELTKEQQDWLNQETLRLLAEKQANFLFYNFKQRLTTDEEFANQLYSQYKTYVINSENKLFTSRFDDQIDDISYFSDWTDTDEFKEALNKRFVKTMENIDEDKLKENLEEAVKDFTESNSLEDILGEEQMEKIRTKIAKLIIK